MSTIGGRQTEFTARPYINYDAEQMILYMGLRPAYRAETGADGEQRPMTDGIGSVRVLRVNPNRVTVDIEDSLQALTAEGRAALRSNRSDIMVALVEVTRRTYPFTEDREPGLELSDHFNIGGVTLNSSCLGVPSHPSLISPTETGAYLPLPSASPVTAKIHTQLGKNNKSSTRRVRMIEISLPGAVKARTGELATFRPKTVQSFADEISRCIPRALSKRLAWLEENSLNKDARRRAEGSIVTLVKAHLDRLQRWGLDDRRVDLATKGSLCRHESRPIAMQLRDGMADTQLIIVAEHDGTKESEETATAGGVSV